MLGHLVIFHYSFVCILYERNEQECLGSRLVMSYCHYEESKVDKIIHVFLKRKQTIEHRE